MTWRIVLDDVDTTSDDFTIGDLVEIERVTGVAWAVANPYRDIKVARAFLAAALLNAGRSNEDVEVALKGLTLGRLKRVFAYVDDEAAAGQETAEEGPFARPSPKGRASSRGASGKGGRRASPGSNA